MKLKFKKGIKSILAFAMAMIMALLPVGDILPEVFAADEVTVTLDYSGIQDPDGNTVSKDNVILYGYNNTSTEKGTAQWTVQAGDNQTELTIYIKYNDYMQYEIPVTVPANASDPITVDPATAKLKTAKDIGSVHIKFEDSDVTVNSSSSIINIGQAIEATTNQPITFTLPVKKVANNATVNGYANGKRTYIYKPTVKEILETVVESNGTLTYTVKNTDVQIEKAETGTITVPQGVTLTFPDNGWYTGPSSNLYKYYKPIGNETIDVTVNPGGGYVFTGVSPETGLEVSIPNKITVKNGAGDFIVNVASTSLPVPSGELTITPEGYGNDKNIYSNKTDLAVTFTPTVGTEKREYTLQYYISTNGSQPNDSDWKDAVISSAANPDKVYYTFTISKKKDAEQAVAEKTIICRYKTPVGSSTSYMSSTIKYDITNPSAGNVKLVAGDSEKDISSDVWVNAETNTAAKLQISEIQDEASGIAKVEYAFHAAGADPSTYTSVDGQNIQDGKLAIQYTIAEKAENLTYIVCDNCGNFVKKTVDLSKIKFDLEAPNVSLVKVQDDGETELTEAQLQNWQPKGVKLTFELTDQEAPAGQVKSDIAGIKVIDDVSGTEVDISDKVTTKDGKYVLVFGDNGEHHLKITAIDNAGNVSDSKEITIKLDKTGIQNPNVILNSINGTTDSTQFAKIFDITAQAESVSGIKEAVVSIYDAEGHAVKEQTITGTDIKVNGDVYQIRYPYTPDADEFNGYVQVKFIDNVAADASGSDPHVKATKRHAFSYNKNGAKISILGNTSWTSEDVRLNISASSKSTTITEIRYYVNGTLVQTIPVNGLQYADTGFTIRENSSMAGTEVRIEAVCGTNPESQIVNSESIVVRVDKQAPALRLAGVTEGAVYNTNRALQITTVENVYNAMKPVQVTATRTIDGATTNIDLGAYQVQSGSDVTNKIFTEDGVYRVTVLTEDAAGNRDSKTVSFTIDKTVPVLNITGVTEGAYSNRPVTLNFQSIESFFETNNVRIMVERRLDGTTYGRNVIFANTAKNSSVSNTFSEDGDYTITMSAIDAAGNEAAVKTLTFTVDCTAPVVSLTGTKDYFVTQSAVALDFSVIESYYQTNQVQIQASRRLANGKVETVSIPAWSNSGKNSSLRQQFTEDGYYTVNITATDKAGNRKEQTIHFTIDTEKPVIADLSKYDGKYLKSFRLEEDMDTLITELTVPTVKMTLNGEAYDGSEVTADGKYTFVIEVTDEVGLTASKTIEFVIDNTLPKIIFAGAEDGKWYTDVVRLNVSLENENDTITEILINGEPYTLTEGKTAYDLTFDTFGDYEVTINSVDTAGNTNSQTISFTYAEHKKVAWLWIGVGAVVLLAGVGVGVMVFLKKGNTNADA